MFVAAPCHAEPVPSRDADSPPVWCSQDSKPGPFVSEMKDASQFYGNRVIKEHKETNLKAVEWVRAFGAMLDALKAYIMHFHTTGLTWNPKVRSLFRRRAAEQRG